MANDLSQIFIRERAKGIGDLFENLCGRTVHIDCEMAPYCRKTGESAEGYASSVEMDLGLTWFTVSIIAYLFH